MKGGAGPLIHNDLEGRTAGGIEVIRCWRFRSEEKRRKKHEENKEGNGSVDGSGNGPEP